MHLDMNLFDRLFGLVHNRLHIDRRAPKDYDAVPDPSGLEYVECISKSLLHLGPRPAALSRSDNLVVHLFLWRIKAREGGEMQSRQYFRFIGNAKPQELLRDPEQLPIFFGRIIADVDAGGTAGFTHVAPIVRSQFGGTASLDSPNAPFSVSARAGFCYTGHRSVARALHPPRR